MKTKVIILMLSLLLSCTDNKPEKVLPKDSNTVQTDTAVYNPADDETTCRS